VTRFVASGSAARRARKLSFLAALQSPLYATLGDNNSSSSSTSASALSPSSSSAQLTVSMALRHANATVRVQAVEALQARLTKSSSSSSSSSSGGGSSGSSSSSVVVVRLSAPASRDLLQLAMAETHPGVAASLFGSRAIFAALRAGLGGSNGSSSNGSSSSSSRGMSAEEEMAGCLAAALDEWVSRSTRDDVTGRVVPARDGHCGTAGIRDKPRRVCAAIMARLSDLAAR
jgi:hypothetical protein